MARPIEPTPRLKGKDAEEFIKSISNVSFSERKERLFKEADAAYIRYIQKK